jgi:hypothetical protein
MGDGVSGFPSGKVWSVPVGGENHASSACRCRCRADCHRFSGFDRGNNVVSVLRRCVSQCRRHTRDEKEGPAISRSKIGSPVPRTIGSGRNVFSAPGLQPSQKHLCRLHIVATAIQRCNHLALKGDVPLHALRQAFSRLQSTLECGAVHASILSARSPLRPFFCPWSRFGLRRLGFGPAWRSRLGGGSFLQPF